MKHSLSITAAALLFVFTSCSQAFLSAEEYGAYPLAEAGSCQDSISLLIERAHQGDGQAYLLLAQCYHDGYGVEHDFLMMWAMTQMAAQYGAIERSEDFFAAYPDNDPDRMLFEAMDLIGWHRYDEALCKAETLARQNAAYAHFVKGGLALEQERKEEALSFFRLAAEEGFVLAEMAVAVAEKGRDSIYHHASRLPLLYCKMARECFKSDSDPSEDEQAARYYRLADEHLCLDETGVRWMLGYCEHTAKADSLSADSAELHRLRILHSKLARP